jgi:hypothetical protein
MVGGVPWECWDLYNNIHDVIFQKSMIDKSFTILVITEFKNGKMVLRYCNVANGTALL